MNEMVQLHYCPQCDGAVNVEHFAEERGTGGLYVIYLLYCESCDTGWEFVYDVVDGRRVYDFTHKIAGSEAREQLDDFLARLRDLTEIAA